MELTYLGINVTKDCNLDCAICLCGEPKKECITKDVIESLFKGIKKVNELYITGGEPLLYPKLIRMVADECKKQKVEISNMSLTTNATIFNDEIKEALLYIFSGTNASITISVDKFHKASIYKKLDNFDKVFIGKTSLYKCLVDRIIIFCKENNIEFKTRDIGKHDLIAKMGRAKNFPEAIEVSRNLYALGNYYHKEHLYIDEVLVDTSGAVLRCDYENDEVERLSIGNVKDNDLEQLIFNKCVKELEQKGIKYNDPEMYKVAIDSIYIKRNLK